MIARLDIEDLALQRGDRILFTGLNASLAAGEALALTGPNGAGKTSLLRTLAGLLTPLDGRVRFFGLDGEIEAETARRRACHLIGHQDGLKTNRLAGEELWFQARWSGGAEGAAVVAAERLGLGRLLGLEVRMLSAGQRRSLALARLIAAPRPLWLLDEPLASLDAGRRNAFGEVMRQHLRGGGMVVAAAHDTLPISVRTMEIGR